MLLVSFPLQFCGDPNIVKLYLEKKTCRHFFSAFVEMWNFFYEAPLSINQGAVSIRKMVLPSVAIPMLKIRRPNGRLIFNMEIAIRK